MSGPLPQKYFYSLLELGNASRPPERLQRWKVSSGMRHEPLAEDSGRNWPKRRDHSRKVSTLAETNQPRFTLTSLSPAMFRSSLFPRWTVQLWRKNTLAVIDLVEAACVHFQQSARTIMRGNSQ
jgi:hypothetical protein